MLTDNERKELSNRIAREIRQFKSTSKTDRNLVFSTVYDRVREFMIIEYGEACEAARRGLSDRYINERSNACWFSVGQALDCLFDIRKIYEFQVDGVNVLLIRRELYAVVKRALNTLYREEWLIRATGLNWDKRECRQYRFAAGREV